METEISLRYKDDRAVTRGLLSSRTWCCVFCKSLPTDEDGTRFFWKAATYLPNCSVTSQKIVIFHMFLCPCKNVQIYLSSSKQEQWKLYLFYIETFLPITPWYHMLMILSWAQA